MTLLRRHRIAAGLLQKEFASKLGVDPSLVCHWEAGTKVPAPRHVPKLARFFGMTRMEMTYLVENVNPPTTVGK